MHVPSLIVAVYALFSSVVPAHAEDPVADAQSIISEQIAAMKAQDAGRAYSFASPGIRGLFPDEKRFFEMVQKNYDAIFHAGNYAFGRSKLVGGGEMVLQEVMITGPGGKDWTAIYEMRLMDDGSYKVNGVRVLKNTASTGI
ncbi:DUF4864 domain-containing protein [Rhizobiales bacterium RZME27]|jgi:hypothetical protein|uniref:DUF4864 domain-containing protein n=1 Tax=Endobacterium cereale TaxID=2663029 RepID=A0A6A8A153_9HYPH|nr:DUF4864 domain-containing protein [Endobacterium cereale]MEB2843468.1 DUF4864 domain-containing protein [Endobacterium cereale]MQY44585.1 DUF4864 domain-containing protein [Endobacterium cereale]